MALFVQQRLRLSALHMIPCAQPVHRSAPQANAEQRFKMLQLALLPFPSLIPDRIEIDRQGPSYTIDTLEYFHKHGVERVCLLVGYDAFLAFATWREWQRIPDYAHIIVLRRDQQTSINDAEFPDDLRQMIKLRAVDDEQQVPAQLHASAHGRVVFLRNPKFVESSSAIRASIERGDSIRHRIPLPVADYIERNRLYRWPVEA